MEVCAFVKFYSVHKDKMIKVVMIKCVKHSTRTMHNYYYNIVHMVGVPTIIIKILHRMTVVIRIKKIYTCFLFTNILFKTDTDYEWMIKGICIQIFDINRL